MPVSIDIQLPRVYQGMLVIYFVKAMKAYDLFPPTTGQTSVLC